jgi:hypothetical protein
MNRNLFQTTFLKKKKNIKSDIELFCLEHGPLVLRKSILKTLDETFADQKNNAFRDATDLMMTSFLCQHYALLNKEALSIRSDKNFFRQAVVRNGAEFVTELLDMIATRPTTFCLNSGFTTESSISSVHFFLSEYFKPSQKSVDVYYAPLEEEKDIHTRLGLSNQIKPLSDSVRKESFELGRNNGNFVVNLCRQLDKPKNASTMSNNHLRAFNIAYIGREMMLSDDGLPHAEFRTTQEKDMSSSLAGQTKTINTCT